MNFTDYNGNTMYVVISLSPLPGPYLLEANLIFSNIIENYFNGKQDDIALGDGI